jgi:hypothetical protein
LLIRTIRKTLKECSSPGIIAWLIYKCNEPHSLEKSLSTCHVFE